MIKIIDTFKDYKACFEENLNISVYEKIKELNEVYSVEQISKLTFNYIENDVIQFLEK